MNIEALVASRLEDLADQVSCLYETGFLEEAKLLRSEGLELAQHYDQGHNFLYINDLKTTR